MKACRHNQRMLLSFLSLVCFLLSLFAVAVQFRRDAGILKRLPVVVAIAMSTLVTPSRVAAQIPVQDQSSPAASPPSDDPQPDRPPAQSPPPVFDRPVSWRLLYSNVIADQKHVWSFPVRLMQGQNWMPTAAVLGATAGLVLLDPSEAGYFRRTPAFHGFNNIFTGNATAIGTGAVPASLFALGLIRRDSKMQHTALLAGEAMADAAILTTVLKDATKRVKPAGFSVSGNLSDSWFEKNGPPYSYIKGNGSFPSGHTIEAFSVATIIARRYRNHRWVPYAAYGLAGLVGFSRLSLSVHFLSDVFMGAALGYSISRFGVLRQ
jgi:membrane-associated phospholipid phosphatase